MELPMLPGREDDVGLLNSLGLSPVMAKIYLILVNSGSLTSNSLSKASAVNRGDVYRALSRLQEIGLVERVIDSPVRWMPVPIREGLSILLEQRDNENSELKKKAEELLGRYKRKSRITMSDDEQKSQFILLSEKAARIRIAEANRNMKTSLDLVNTWRMRQLAFFNSIGREKALAKGVRFRIVTDVPPIGESIRGAKQIKESLSHELRYCANPPTALVRIFDGKEVFVLTSPSSSSNDSSALWTCNSSLVSMAQIYFDAIWQTSMMCKKNKTNEL
jgi:sugar-specific transcriptional regulator TrmB